MPSAGFWSPIAPTGLVSAVILLCGVQAARAQQQVNPTTWNFDADRVNESPKGFSFSRTGNGRKGRWVVWPAKDAPSRTNVLAQLDNDDTDFRFPIAVASATRLTDVRLSVKCKPVSGAVDEACGLVFRYQDANNYYLTRANALEHNVRLYKVVGSHRQQLAGWSGPVTRGVWHALRVEALGDHMIVSWDGQNIIVVDDHTFRDAGSIGVWTKADSVTYFDDLVVEPLHP